MLYIQPPTRDPTLTYYHHHVRTQLCPSDVVYNRGSHYYMDVPRRRSGSHNDETPDRRFILEGPHTIPILFFRCGCRPAHFSSLTVHVSLHCCLQLLHIFQDAWNIVRYSWYRESKYVPIHLIIRCPFRPVLITMYYSWGESDGFRSIQ